MRKVIFLDYTGTIIQEGGKDMEKLVKRFLTHSSVKRPEKMIAYWWGMLKEYEASSYQEQFLTEDEIVDRMLERCEREISLKDSREELHDLCRRYWVYAPVFDDVKPFFDACPLPIYVISNNGVRYVEEGMRLHGLRPAGIISGEMVRAYKPHKEIFEKALEVSGCSPNQAVHIGDSRISDVEGAKSVGIWPILLDRKGKEDGSLTDCVTVSSLMEALEWIRTHTVWG